jgi:hypothetical protein
MFRQVHQVPASAGSGLRVGAQPLEDSIRQSGGG